MIMEKKKKSLPVIPPVFHFWHPTIVSKMWQFLWGPHSLGRYQRTPWSDSPLPHPHADSVHHHSTYIPWVLFASGGRGGKLTAYGNSQPRGRIRATTAGLHHGHSNAGFLTHWVRSGIELASSWILVGFVSSAPQWELLNREFCTTCCICMKHSFPNLHKSSFSPHLISAQMITRKASPDSHYKVGCST